MLIMFINPYFMKTKKRKSTPNTIAFKTNFDGVIFEDIDEADGLKFSR